jgi:anti-sigma factor ChrR (cupin superfamily)
MLRCEDVTRLATEHLEGALPPGLGLRLRAHLALCRTCRAFLASLKALPRILDEPPGAREAAPPDPGRSALAAALARIAGGEARPLPPPAHPAPAEALEGADRPDGDRTLGLMVAAYRALRAAGPLPEEPYLPSALREALPEPGRWRWRRALLRGCRATELLRDPRSGACLYLLVLPTGAAFPDHRHEGLEDFLVLHGNAEDDRHYLGPGDWLRTGPGTEHRCLQGRRETCWGLARVERGGLRLLGWRGRLQRLLGVDGG